MGIRKVEEFEVNFLQDIKRLLAANLTGKGQASVATETLTALVNKVANVNTGKKFATGTITATNSAPASPNVIVTGLSFTPTLVLVRNSNNLLFLVNSSLRIYNNASYYKSGAITIGNDGRTDPLMQGPGYDDRITTSGFQIGTTQVSGQSLTYYAYE